MELQTKQVLESIYVSECSEGYVNHVKMLIKIASTIIEKKDGCSLESSLMKVQGRQALETVT